MKARSTLTKQEAETNAQVEIENQHTPESESTGSEYAAASLNRASMPPAGNPSANHHTELVQRARKSNPAYSQQLFHHLQRTHGNRYLQRIVELSRKGNDPAEVEEGVEQTIQSKRGGGRAMDNRVRQQMEMGFGRDFSGVRVHTDSDADGLNKNLSARAFTTGSDIFFRSGEYQPGNSSGRELLAHELTHVVQQGGESASASE